MKKLVLSSVLFPILAAACANDGGSPLADLGATAQAMQDGTPETGPRTAGQRATVALRQVGNSEGGWVCSGHLVTPSLVLTAAHCIWPLGEQGRVSYVGFVAATSGAVTSSTPSASFENVADAWGMAINQQNDDSASARDIALIEIADVDAVSPATFEGFAQPQSQRPLAAVDLSVPLVVGAVQSSYGHTSSTTVGVGLYPVSAFFSSLVRRPFVSGPSKDFATLVSSSTGPQTTEGDSGGTLAVASSLSAPRSPVGVVSSGDVAQATGRTVTSYFADLTAPAAQSWLAQKARVPMTDAWRRQHAWAGADRWRGEVEYTGACNPAQDQDCDHWLDVHDNCPTAFNPSQVDADDDGVGDRCVCPCDPGNNFADPDGDGICGKTCSGDREDNCPTVPNADQRNSNLLAEQALSLPLVGDACEPVPVHVTRAEIVTQGVRCTTLGSLAGKHCDGVEVHDVIESTPLASRNNRALGGKAGSDGALAPMPVYRQEVVPAPLVYQRFCQDTDVRDCSDPLLAGQQLQRKVGDPLAPYNATTLRPTTTPVSAWEPIGRPYKALDYVGSLDDLSADTVRQWDYLGDKSRWVASGVVTAPSPSAECVKRGQSCLRGTWLSISDTPIGSTDTTSMGGTPANGIGGVHGDGLAAHFRAYTPDIYRSFYVAGRGFELFPLFLWRTLPDPAPKVIHWSHDTGLSGPLAAGNGAISLDDLGVRLTTAAAARLAKRPLLAVLGDPEAGWGASPNQTVAPIFAPKNDDPWVDSLVAGTQLSLASEGAGAAWGADTGVVKPRVAPVATWSSARGALLYGGGTIDGMPVADVYVRRIPNGNERTYWRPILDRSDGKTVIDALTLEPSTNTVYVAIRAATDVQIVAVRLADLSTKVILAGSAPSTVRVDLSLGRAGEVYVTALGTGSAKITRLETPTGVCKVSGRFTSHSPWLMAPVASGARFVLFDGTPGSGVLTGERTEALPWTGASTVAVDAAKPCSADGVFL